LTHSTGRRQRLPRGVLRLALVLVLGLVACGSPAPADVSLSVVSDEGLVQAEVRVASPVVRGDNELFVELHPTQVGAEASLLSVGATMAAHGHQAQALDIERVEGGFHAGHLDLFMTGRWLVELRLGVDEATDSVSFPVDVP
jgi:hypothetical protein